MENDDLSHQALWELEKVTVYVTESVEYVYHLGFPLSKPYNTG
jgi:hypothetical protein